MDSKSSLPSSSHAEEPLPPPTYAESQITGSSCNYHNNRDTKEKSSSHLPPSSTHQTYSSQIQQQLSTLTTSLTSIQAQRSLLTTAQDEKILDLLTQEIRTYLTDFATSGLHQGQLILVPAAAIKEAIAAPMSCDVNSSVEFNRFARVVDEENLRALADHDRARQEYGYGYGEEEVLGDLWFWNDEKMAKRLAGYLRPERESQAGKKLVELPPRPTAGERESEKKSRWGWRKKKDNVREEAPRVVEVVEVKKEDGVVMDIKAQEVCFEVENDCGVLESRSGFGIVMRLKVAMSS